MDAVVSTMEKPETIQQFIQQEMDKRGLSNRKFAQLVGISHKTINKYMDAATGDDVAPPVEVLIKIAKATNTNVITLLILAYPDVEPGLKDLASISGADLLRSQRIQQLPESLREAVDTIIFERAQVGKKSD